jgi:tRNA-specific 2-thiouridylase
VVGMSGGVDSSVTALLLKQQGYEVTGLFMKNWEDDDNDEYCSSRQDLLDAVSVADTIGIPIEAVNFSKEYKERVFSDFLHEYRAGRTPNPDILCNAEIKFKAFLEHAMQLGADVIATGHYAQVRETDGLYQLLKASDENKDQSYFLHRLNQAQLSHAIFPLGKMLKSQVRNIAERHGLPNHAKRDSTGICFILGIGGSREASGEPWFVCNKDMANNRLFVVQGHDHPSLLAPRLSGLDSHWISGTAPPIDHQFAAKTRYRQADAPCQLTRISGNTCEIAFDDAQWAITPGQSVVIYDGEVCLGGAIIEQGHG